MFGFIKKRLKDLGKTQIELAESLNIYPSHLNAILSGKRAVQGREIAPLAKFLKLDIAKFAQYVAGQIDEKTLLKEEQPDQLTQEEKHFVELLRKSKETPSEKSETTKAG